MLSNWYINQQIAETRQRELRREAQAHRQWRGLHLAASGSRRSIKRLGLALALLGMR